MANDTYVKHGLAIINPYGGIWTPHVFSTSDEAMKYMNEFWKGKNDRMREYRLAVATLTVTLDRSPGVPTIIPLPDAVGGSRDA